MKEHIKSLPHHPKRVIVISLIIALAIGTFGYLKINKETPPEKITDATNQTTDATATHNLTLGFLASGRIKSVLVKAGDLVKKGQTLATLDAGNTEGALIQAQAALKIAQNNYQKIINGATSAAIDVAKSAVHTAQVNLDGATKQQNILVANAHSALLNSTLSANLLNSNTSMVPPTLSGTYNKDTEGSIVFTVNQAGNDSYVTFSGVASGTTPVSTTAPQALGDTGLYIEFNSVSAYIGTTWKINIPNTTASNYLANYNSYQSALQTQNQTVGNAQAALDQANAMLTALVTDARPEDIAVAQAQVDNASGAVKIAQAAFQNTVISAPSDGTIVSVAITPGQIAVPNAPAIEFISN